ncbi:exodeoxyribonuclease III [Candidatus Saccharibacteria bacterium]|nr:exodeoxyribonuclease III [Candidatus Saccharibacteria bacterium]
MSNSNTLRLFSWNVNGLRAVLRKGSIQDFLTSFQPDILALQEIKCKPAQLDFDFADIGYNIILNPADRPGYSGTGFLIKQDLNVSKKTIDHKRVESFTNIAKSEGRVQILDLGPVFLVNVYTPNSKPDLSRLTLRHDSWDPNFLSLLKSLEKEKPVLTCGDFNAAHEEIDLARPAQNRHNAGFTNEEREGVKNLLNAGFLDTFREKHPNSKRYTWWSHWGHARENNVGWRIDYFFASNTLTPRLHEAEIHESVLGSDHCPVSLTLAV